MHINIHYHIIVFLLYSFSVKYIIHCRHYSAYSTLGKKKVECLLLDPVLRFRLLGSDPALALSPVGAGDFSGAPCESRKVFPCSQARSEL